MSAGGFVNSKYELTADTDIRVPIRIQPETLTLRVENTNNVAPSGALTPHWPSARVSGGRRGLGIMPRMVRFKFTEGNTPAGYKEGATLTVPALTTTFAALCQKGTTGTYQVGGTPVPIVIVGAVAPEIIR